MARLTALGWVTKMILFPGALAALGYFVIGPQLGGDIPKTVRNVLGGVARAPKKPSTGLDEEPKPVVSAGTNLDGPPPPEVKVRVRPLSAVEVRAPEEEKPKRRRRRRRRRSTPSTSPSTAPRTESPAAPSEPATADG